MLSARISSSAVALLLLAGSSQAVSACSIDGKPSLAANGLLARVYTVRPNPANFQHWAPFAFASSFPAGTKIQLSENLANVRLSLPAQRLRKPWRWSFGDGTTGTGASTVHSYARPGDYRLGVSAYYSSYKRWFEFDAVLVHISAH